MSSLSGVKPSAGIHRITNVITVSSRTNALAESVDEIYINTHSIIPDAKVLDALFKRLMFQ